MFRVQGAASPASCCERHREQVKTGLPGVAWLRIDPTSRLARAPGREGSLPLTPAAPWPARRSCTLQRRQPALWRVTWRSTALTCEMPAGRMVGLIGPDGVGKSSLLALVAGARADPAGAGRGARRRHGRAPPPRGGAARASPTCRRAWARTCTRTLSVEENLRFLRPPVRPRRAPSAGAASTELLAAPACTPFADRPAGKLSGGMKQKLGLCCALIHDPDLLILDEPTTGVDPLSRRQFWELIARIRAERPGMSVLVATAYMEEAERFDWLVAMDAGRVLATGTPAELRSAPASDSLEAAFIALLPEPSGAGHQPLVITAPPLQRRRDRHRGPGPDHALRRLRGGGPCQLPHRPRRDLRLSGLQRLRQVHHHEDAHRPAAASRRRGPAVRPAGRPARHGHPPPRRLHVAGASRCTAN